MRRAGWELQGRKARNRRILRLCECFAGSGDERGLAVQMPFFGQQHIGILKADLAMEQDAIPLLREAIKHCESVADYVSREVLERILESEEEHVDFLETQFEMIARMGLQNYVQLQSEPAGE